MTRMNMSPRQNGLPSASALRVTVGLIAIACVALSTCAATPLDDYVLRPDPSYGWTATGVNFSSTGYTAHFFNLTSLTWLTAADTDRPLWQHTMIFIMPDQLNSSCTDAFVWYTWGKNNKPWSPDAENDVDLAVVTQMALRTNCPAIAVYQIPSEPLYFYAAGEKLSEDNAIGFTFNRFLFHNASDEWLMLFPMTKAAVRALDAVQEIAPRYFGLQLSKFVISGASKRGWTTWLCGAVEAASKNRVIAMVPVVLDLLGMENFLHRQFRSYGGYSFALEPYWKNGLTAATGSARMKQLTELIDPLVYASRLVVPKLTVNAVGDEFQLLDDQRHWAHDMPGEMKLLMVKNADHILVTNFGEVIEAVGGFVHSVAKGYTRPSYSWTIGADGQVSVTTSVPPKKVAVVHATVKTKMRDFRDAVLHTDDCLVKIVGGCLRFIFWTTTTDGNLIVQHTPTSFTTNVPVPPTGWTGFFIELTFASPIAGGPDLLFTSPANVLPLGYPFPDCKGSNCTGVLV